MTNSDTPRIVITGIGWVTPLGHDIDSVWAALLNTQSGMAPIRRFDASSFPTTFASEVTNYDYRPYVNHPEWHEGIGPNIAFALGAASQAWRMAGLDQTAELDRDRFGLYLGAGEGVLDFAPYAATHVGSWSVENKTIDTVKWAELAAKNLSPRAELTQEPNMPLTHLAMEFDLRGPACNCLTACAASTQAVGEATEILRRGEADIMMAGGTHTMIHPLGVTGFNRLTALSNRNDDPTTASRPFNKTRDGFVLGEGSGILIIETLEHAKARNANILAEIIGYGSSADAYRITDMHPESRGPIAAMTGALRDAGLTPSQVDYISAHGTSTSENDAVETRAIKAVFGPDAPPTSSIKSMMGHLIAAAGAVELITCVLAIRDQILPPTANYIDPDPDLDLDYIANAARQATVEVCLSNSFGFGGQNDTLAIRRWDEV